MWGRAQPGRSRDAGTVVVFDKGYIDSKWWQQLDQQGVFFVSRLKKDAKFTVIQDRDLPATQKQIPGRAKSR